MMESECVYMKDLIDDVQTLLDMAFETVVLDKDYDEIDVGEYENDEVMKRKLDLWTNSNIIRFKCISG